VSFVSIISCLTFVPLPDRLVAVVVAFLRTKDDCMKKKRTMAYSAFTREDFGHFIVI